MRKYKPRKDNSFHIEKKLFEEVKALQEDGINGNGHSPENLKILEHLPYITRCLSKYLFTKFRSEFDRADLISEGLLGLVEAAHRPIPTDTTDNFKAYSFARSFGYVMEFLRKNSNTVRLPRSFIKQASFVKKKVEEFYELGHPDDEFYDFLIERTKMSPEQLDKVLRFFDGINVYSMDEPNIDSQRSRGVSYRHLDKTSPEYKKMGSYARVDDALEYKGIRNIISLLGLKGKITPNEWYVINEYYSDKGRTMREISEDLDLTESRVSQIHSSAIAKTKMYLQRNNGL